MSVAGARMRMDLALKDLQIKWAQASQSWNDPVSRAFESNYLDALHQGCRLAGSALDKMRDAIARAKRECGES